MATFILHILLNPCLKSIDPSLIPDPDYLTMWMVVDEAERMHGCMSRGLFPNKFGLAVVTVSLRHPRTSSRPWRSASHCEGGTSLSRSCNGQGSLLMGTDLIKIRPRKQQPRTLRINRDKVGRSAPQTFAPSINRSQFLLLVPGGLVMCCTARTAVSSFCCSLDLIQQGSTTSRLLR